MAAAALLLAHPGVQAGTISKPPTTFIASPNYGNRNGTPIDSVVIHTTEVSLQGTIDIFTNPANQVSAHFVVAPNGDIYQMVDTAKRAWHATYFNSRSVGIEMVGYAHQASTWNDNNLASLVDLLSWILDANPLIPLTHPSGDAYDYPGDRYNTPGLVAHGQVQPWNRTDPGPYFPWNDVLAAVDARLNATPEPATLLLAAIGVLGVCRLKRREHATRASAAQRLTVR